MAAAAAAAAAYLLSFFLACDFSAPPVVCLLVMFPSRLQSLSCIVHLTAEWKQLIKG